MYDPCKTGLRLGRILFGLDRHGEHVYATEAVCIRSERESLDVFIREFLHSSVLLRDGLQAPAAPGGFRAS